MSADKYLQYGSYDSKEVRPDDLIPGTEYAIVHYNYSKNKPILKLIRTFSHINATHNCAVFKPGPGAAPGSDGPCFTLGHGPSQARFYTIDTPITPAEKTLSNLRGVAVLGNKYSAEHPNTQIPYNVESVIGSYLSGKQGTLQQQSQQVVKNVKHTTEYPRFKTNNRIADPKNYAGTFPVSTNLLPKPTKRKRQARKRKTRRSRH